MGIASGAAVRRGMGNGAVRGWTAASICTLALLLLACTESTPAEPTEASGARATLAQPVGTSIAPSITAAPSTTATTAAPAATTAETTAIATTTVTTTTTTTRPPFVCWDGSTARLRGLCPREPRWEFWEWEDEFGDPVVHSELVSKDGEAVIRLTCYQDVLNVFVGEQDEIEEQDWYYRPDARGNAGGRFKGRNQDSATNVSWQKLETAAGDPTIRGVYLPKSYRRSFVDALRSDNHLIVDWFYETHTFEWPEANTLYEQPLTTCGW